MTGAVTHKPIAQQAFLAMYRETANVTRSAKAAGINARRHYDWLARDPEYVEKFEEAYLAACDELEAEARRRAVEGVKEPVYQGGANVGYKRRYSDTLLIFLLKGHLPEKYADRKHISANVGGGPLELVEEIIFENSEIDREQVIEHVADIDDGDDDFEPTDESGLF